MKRFNVEDFDVSNRTKTSNPKADKKRSAPLSAREVPYQAAEPAVARVEGRPVAPNKTQVNTKMPPETPVVQTRRQQAVYQAMPESPPRARVTPAAQERVAPVYQVSQPAITRHADEPGYADSNSAKHARQVAVTPRADWNTPGKKASQQPAKQDKEAPKEPAAKAHTQQTNTQTVADKAPVGTGFTTRSADSGFRHSIAVDALRVPNSPKVEALRKVVSRLLLANRGRKLSPMAVCSVAPGDGRSFVASNLAVLFAQAGKRTLLIDADFRHADQHNIFSLDAGPGLAELLMGHSDWDVIKPVEAVEDLFVLPFGRHSGDPLELLASDVFVDVFNRLVDICDVVLIDTPAGDRYVDAQVVAAQVGTAMLVIKQDTTALNSARELKQALTRAGVDVLGAVINRV